jgi:uncharacterized Tic20 family protein
MFRAQLTKRAVIGHAVLPVGIALFLTLFPLRAWVMVEGSQSFVDFAAQHSLGYPIFLALISLITPERFDVAYVQVWIYSLAVFALSLAIFRVSTNHFFAVLSAVCLCFNPFMLMAHFTILPGSLFMSASLFALAFFLHAIARPGIFVLFGFGLSLGFAIVLCPYGLAYLPLILVAPSLVRRKNHCSFAKAFFVPVLACIGLLSVESNVYYNLHNGRDYHPAASALFASAALMDSEQSSPYASRDPRTALWDRIEQDLKAIRTEIWQADLFSTRKDLLHSQQRYVGQDFAINALTQAGFLLDKSVDDIRLEIATARIIQAPLAFLEITINHYRGIWTSDNMLSYPFWILSLLTVLAGIWSWVKGAAFNGAFALAFFSAFMVQGQTILTAHIGIGPEKPLMFFSPLLNLVVIAILLGVYMTFINPPRTNG